MTEKDITYDRNGNVTGLKRYDADGVLDELHFTHSGNRIYEVANNTWSYDDNGNMNHNASQDLDLEYYLLNLPREARHMNDTVSYQYLADGTKLSALTNVGDGLKYRGNFVYETVAEPVDWYDDLGNHITDPILWESLASIAWDEGRIVFDNPFAVAVDTIVVDEPVLEEGLQAGLLAHGFEFGEQIDTTEAVVGLIGAMHDEWFVKDHLGSVRAIVRIDGDAVSATDRITEVNDYLPFGTRIPTDLQASTNRHRFSGKEEQRFGSLDMGTGGDRVSLNLLDFGARYYDPYTCRWTTIDPMAGKYHSLSPYNYCAGDPINVVDPHGLEGVKEVDAEGNITITSNVVVLLEKQKEIPSDASERQVNRITRKNQRIANRNTSRLAAIKSFLSEEFSQTMTSNGTSVSFNFNIIPLEVSNPGKIDKMEADIISLDNGIHNVETPDRIDGQLGKNIARAAIIGQGGSGSALGLTKWKALITANDFSARTIAHEMGHTLGLLDNYPYKNGGLMDYPAGAISPTDVDHIINKAYVKKK